MRHLPFPNASLHFPKSALWTPNSCLNEHFTPCEDLWLDSL